MVISAFLDVETSWERTITIIGIYRSGLGTTQLIAPNIDRAALLQTLEDVDRIYTYNGTGFDLPVIERWLGIQLTGLAPHRDLMYDCRKRKLKGGLKGAERTLGIHRDTEGMDGIQAMKLWAAYEQGDRDALELLLLYNKEDCVNLEILALKFGLLPVEGDRAHHNPYSAPSPGSLREGGRRPDEGTTLPSPFTLSLNRERGF